MKIILKENIENLGKKGDIVNVAAGYGRNYLLPRKLALKVTASNMKMIELEQAALRKKLEKDLTSVHALIERLNQVSLSFTRKAGEKDAIFGSVSASDIKEALDNLGFEIEKKRIALEEPIKRLGNFKITIKVFHEQKAEINVEVAKESEQEEQKKTPEKETAPAAAPAEEIVVEAKEEQDEAEKSSPNDEAAEAVEGISEDVAAEEPETAGTEEEK